MTRLHVERATVGATLASVLALVVVAASPATPPGATATIPSGSVHFLSYGPPDWHAGSRRSTRLYALDARGDGQLREVIQDVGEAHWSPDGKHLAFLRLIGGAKAVGLYVRTASGRPRLVAQYAGPLPLPIDHSSAGLPTARESHTRPRERFESSASRMVGGFASARARARPGHRMGGRSHSLCTTAWDRTVGRSTSPTRPAGTPRSCAPTSA
jgi:hypothetical protein